jgi:hypothetical protein
LQVKRGAEDSAESAPKRLRDEGASQKIKDQLAMKYGSSKEAGAAGAGEVKALSDQLDIDKINEIKKKILSNRRTRIKMDGDDGGDRGLASFADLESDRSVPVASSPSPHPFHLTGPKRSYPVSASGGQEQQSSRATGSSSRRTSWRS